MLKMKHLYTCTTSHNILPKNLLQERHFFSFYLGRSGAKVLSFFRVLRCLVHPDRSPHLSVYTLQKHHHSSFPPQLSLHVHSEVSFRIITSIQYQMKRDPTWSLTWQILDITKCIKNKKENMKGENYIIIMPALVFVNVEVERQFLFLKPSRCLTALPFNYLSFYLNNLSAVN